MTCEYNSYTTVSWLMIYAVIAKPARVHFVQILVLFLIINPSNQRHSKSLQLRDMPHAAWSALSNTNNRRRTINGEFSA
jgi:hypothetical protein